MDSDAGGALRLLNQLREAFGEGPLPAPLKDSPLARELDAAYPLLALMAPKLTAAAPPVEVLEDIRHNWNKALRRRQWHALPALPQDAHSRRQVQAAQLERFLAMFGISWKADECRDEILANASTLAGLLESRLDELRGPPLPSPARYAQALAEVSETWNELATTHPELPRIGG